MPRDRDRHDKRCMINLTGGACDCGVLSVQDYDETTGEMYDRDAEDDAQHACGDCRFGMRHLAPHPDRKKRGHPRALGHCIMHSIRVGYRTPSCSRFEWRQPTKAKTK